MRPSRTHHRLRVSPETDSFSLSLSLFRSSGFMSRICRSRISETAFTAARIVMIIMKFFLLLLLFFFSFSSSLLLLMMKKKKEEEERRTVILLCLYLFFEVQHTLSRPGGRRDTLFFPLVQHIGSGLCMRVARSLSSRCRKHACRSL